MADTNLGAALMGLNVPATENPWGIGASTLGTIAPNLINPQGRVGTNLGIGLGSILLTALLGYQARQTAAEESLTTNKLAQQMMNLQTPEERTSFIEQQKGDISPRLTGRLLTLGTALQAQEKAQTLDAESKYLDQMAQLKAAVSPLGRQKQQMDMDLLMARLNQQQANAKEMENLRQGNRMTLLDKRKQDQMELKDLGARLAEEARKNTLTSAQATDLRDRYDIALRMQNLADELEGMSEFDAKASLSGILGSRIAQTRPGFLQEFNNVKTIYSHPLFGLSLTGNELANRELMFGASTLATKADAIAALRSMADERLKGGQTLLGIKQASVPDIYDRFGLARQGMGTPFEVSAPPESSAPTGSVVTPVPTPANEQDKIAELNRILSNPNIPEEKKAPIRAQLQSLGL